MCSSPAAAVGAVGRFIMDILPCSAGEGAPAACYACQVYVRNQATLSLYGLVPVDQSSHPSETARRHAFPDGRGEIGLIAPVSEPFCGHCNRLRLTADGKLRTCLFSLEEHDLRPLLRGDASDADIAARMRDIVRGKEAGHRIGQPDFVQPQRTMSCIGG